MIHVKVQTWFPMVMQVYLNGHDWLARKLSFGAKEVMAFLGRKLHGKFEGEIITDVIDLSNRRIPGARVKHRVKENWIKMYDEAGIVLRIETVINNPEEFKVNCPGFAGGSIP